MAVVEEVTASWVLVRCVAVGDGIVRGFSGWVEETDYVALWIDLVTDRISSTVQRDKSRDTDGIVESCDDVRVVVVVVNVVLVVDTSSIRRTARQQTRQDMEIMSFKQEQKTQRTHLPRILSLAQLGSIFETA